jgi:purine-binding chemotaxis protein CheW
MTSSPSRVEQPAEGRTQYLAFLVGRDEYAVPILKVREIFAFEDATRVPATPPWIRGVVNLRGQVLPVIDLGVKFGLPPIVVGTRTCVVVFELAIDGLPTSVGALVDEVSQVLEIAESEIEPPPSFGTQIRVEYLAGATLSKGRFALLLDTDRVLRDDELLAVSAAVGAADPPATPAAD